MNFNEGSHSHIIHFYSDSEISSITDDSESDSITRPVSQVTKLTPISKYSAPKTYKVVPVSPKRELLSSAKGEFIKIFCNLSTHFKIYGERSSKYPTIVCIHGLTVGMQTWDYLGPYLASLGRQVLVYDMFGRGLSDSFFGDHKLELYVDQLADLISKLGNRINGHIVDIIGSSLGAVVGIRFALQFPTRVNKLMMFSPTGYRYHDSNFSKLVRSWIRTPVARSLFYASGLPKVILKDFIRNCYPVGSAVDIKRDLKVIKASRKYHPAFVHSVFSMCVHAYSSETQFSQMYERLAYHPPTGGIVVVWATDDKFCSFNDSAAFVEQFADSATVIAAEHCEHGELLNGDAKGWTTTKTVLQLFFGNQNLSSTNSNNHNNTSIGTITSNNDESVVHSVNVVQSNVTSDSNDSKPHYFYVESEVSTNDNHSHFK